MVQFQNAPAPGHIRHTRICKNRQGAQRKIRATLITIKKSASRQKHMEYCTAHKDLQGQARRPREKEANKETRHASLSASIRLLRLQRLSPHQAELRASGQHQDLGPPGSLSHRCPKRADQETDPLLRGGQSVPLFRSSVACSGLSTPSRAHRRCHRKESMRAQAFGKRKNNCCRLKGSFSVVKCDCGWCLCTAIETSMVWWRTVRVPKGREENTPTTDAFWLSVQCQEHSRTWEIQEEKLDV